MSSSPPLQHPALPQLAAFAMSRLGAAAQGAVRDHLAQCPSCRKTLAALKATNARTLPPPLPQVPGPTTTGSPAPPVSQTSVGRAAPARASGDAAPPPEFANHARYQIVKLLGEGGMGAVYLAQDKQLGRKVALKIPRVGAGSETILARFQREARAAATLDHPNICPVYDVGTVEGVPYLTMAYIEGRPLANLLAPRKQLPERQVAGMVRKLALILHEAHKHGIIHRDLKPGNVMINSRKEPIIMDFGLARRVGAEEARITQDGAALGTPSYMPPEQVSGDVDHMGPGCDIYALGVLLYELLTGRLPFEGPPMQVLCQVLLDTPKPPSAHRPDVNRGLEAVCLKAMAKKPEERFASMADFAAALSQYSQFRDPRPFRKRLPRRAWSAVAGAAALLAVVVGLLVARNRTAASKADEPAADGTVTNSVGMKLAPIPAGKFLMGAMPGEAGAHPQESPRHRVEITRPFQMGAHEVTQAQFEWVMGFNPSHFAPTGEGADKVAGLDTGNFPVECVSWAEAVAFCRKLSELPAEKAAGRAYRLPTEAEWEYACRVGAETAFYPGGTLTAKQANINGWFRYGASERGPNLQRTAAVGSYPPNDYGLFDLHGNVWEWCHDWFNGGYYAKSPATDPTGPDAGDTRVLRGGAWENVNLASGQDHRCSNRGAAPPGARMRVYGFRVVCVPAPGSGPMPGEPDEVQPPPSAPNAIDLLKLIDLQKTFVFGDWKMERGVLVSPTAHGSKLQIPYVPPEEYRIVMVVERTWYKQGLLLGVPLGKHRTMINLDGWDGARSGLTLLDGFMADNNETTYRETVLKEGKPCTVVCSVGKDTIRVSCDGRKIIDWKGDPGRLSIQPANAVPDERTLSLQSWTSFRISRLELVSLTGRGRPITDYAGELRRFQHGPGTHGIALSPDGRQALLSLNHPHVWLHDAATLRTVRTLHGQHAGSDLGAAFVNGGKWRLVAGYDGRIRIWEAATGAEIWHYAGFPGHAKPIAVLPDGKRFLTGGTDGVVRLWGLPTEKMVRDPKDPYGLKAEYFQGTDLKDKVAERIDRQIDRAYHGGAPIDRVGTEYYSIRWTGWLKAPAPGKYRLVAHVDDGIRLWLDDKLLIDHWHVGSFALHADVELTRKPHALKIEYFQAHGPAWLSLRWSQTGGFAEQPIPAEVLFHDEDAAQQTAPRLPKELKRLVGHGGTVWSVAVAPNGRDVLTAGEDGTLRLWDLQTGKEVRRLAGHTGFAFCVAFAPDGRRALSGGQDWTLYEWEVATGKELRRYRGHRADIRWLAYSPDGRRAATTSYDGTVRLWDLEAQAEGRKELHCFRGHTASTHSVAFSPDGKRLFSTSGDATVRIWQIPSDEALRAQWPEPKREPPGPPVDLLKLIDGKDHFVRGEWKIENGVLTSPGRDRDNVLEIPYVPPPEYRLEMTISRAGFADCIGILFPMGQNLSSVAVGGWDGATSGIHGLDGRDAANNESTRRMAVFRENQAQNLVLTVKRDRLQVSSDGATVIDWTGDPRRMTPDPQWAVPARDTLLLCAHTSRFRISKLLLTPLAGTGRPTPVEGEVCRMRDYTTGVAAAPDGKHILSVGPAPLRFWDAVSGTLLRSVEGHRGNVTRAAYSPDGRRILTGSADGTVRLWDAEGRGMIRQYPGHPGDWTCVAFSPDGRKAASGGVDAKVRIWDLPPPGAAAANPEDNARPFQGHTNRIWTVCFSPDGIHLLTTSEDGTARLWNVATGKEVRRFEEHKAPVYCATFTADGRRAITGGRDHYLRIWDVDTGKQVGRLAGHRALVFCLALSADGTRLLSGSDDTTVRLWDVEGGKELHNFTGHTHWVRGVAFHPDGRRVLSGSPDSTVRVWLLPESLWQAPRGQ